MDAARTMSGGAEARTELRVRVRVASASANATAGRLGHGSTTQTLGALRDALGVELLQPISVAVRRGGRRPDEADS